MGVLAVHTIEGIGGNQMGPCCGDSRYNLKLLHLVLDDRYLWGLGTIFTFELSPQKGVPCGNGSHLGDVIVSRVMNADPQVEHASVCQLSRAYILMEGPFLVDLHISAQEAVLGLPEVGKF